jgi:hypothetical protein
MQFAMGVVRVVCRGNAVQTSEIARTTAENCGICLLNGGIVFMKNMQRPSSRIGYILPKLSHVWHYYPELSLAELLLEITFEANLVQSDLPITTLDDIEDIAYPEGHPFYVSRNLEMGILEIENRHKGQPLPPTPIQAAYIQKVEKAWRNRPQLRLGQWLSNARHLHQP